MTMKCDVCDKISHDVNHVTPKWRQNGGKQSKCDKCGYVMGTKPMQMGVHSVTDRWMGRQTCDKCGKYGRNKTTT